MTSQEASDTSHLSMFEEFDPRWIDTRWQDVWTSERSWEVSNDATDHERAYVLEKGSGCWP